jgi:thioredoxin-related protein
MRIPEEKKLFQAKQQAKKDNKNILLLTHLEDCSWCYFVINEVIAPMTELREYTDKLIIAQIEIHAGLSMVDFDGVQIENNDFADKYDIDFYPTLLLFDAEGMLLEKIVGVASEDTYWTDLDKKLEKHY